MKRFTKPKSLILLLLVGIVATGIGLNLNLSGVPRLRLPGVPVGPPSLVSGAYPFAGLAWLASDGSLWFLGEDRHGIFGTNDSCSRIPRRLGEFHDWKSMAVSGDQWIGIRRDGSAWGWNGSLRGHARSVQLPSLLPQRLVPGTNWVQSISSGVGTFYLLSADGSLWAAGDNREGALGDGTTLGRSNFVAVTMAHRWKAVAAGARSAAAIGTNGTLWVWGWAGHLVPTRVGTASNWVQVLGRDYLFTAQNSEGDWVVWDLNANLLIPGAPEFPKEPLIILPSSRRWSTVIPSGISVVTRDHEGNYNYQGLGFAELNAKPSEDPNTPRPIQRPNGVHEIHPAGDSPGTILAWSPDSTLWIWGENPGALCPQTPADRLRLWIVSKLNRLGMDSPALRRWGNPPTRTTHFTPVARFVAP
ncbi:MAG: hypothetical protein U1G08_18435 [Verrucomicrobiota bacterium]